MREIKFRAWDKEKQEMLYPNDFFNFSVGLREGRTEVMQFTGLKDKNDTEIYEGDVLKIKDEHGVEKIIVMRFENHKVGDFLNWEISGFRDYSKGTYDKIVEVIGNIYENPELVEGQS